MSKKKIIRENLSDRIDRQVMNNMPPGSFLITKDGLIPNEKDEAMKNKSQISNLKSQKEKEKESDSK